MNRPLDDWSALETSTKIVLSTPRKVATWTYLVVLVLATIFAMVDIESIVFMAPICSIFAIILLLTSQKKQRKYRRWATSGLLFCIFCATLIVVFDLAPSQAQLPVSILIAGYVSGTIVYYATRFEAPFKIVS